MKPLSPSGEGDDPVFGSEPVNDDLPGKRATPVERIRFATSLAEFTTAGRRTL